MKIKKENYIYVPKYLKRLYENRRIKYIIFIFFLFIIANYVKAFALIM